MENYDLGIDEVVLYKGSVFRDDIKGSSNLILTSKKIIFEQTRITKIGLFKTKTEKVKGAFNKVDDILGFNTRDTIKGVIENGITGTLLKGIKKNKK